MKTNIKAVSLKAFLAILVFTLICGVLYPLLSTALCQLFFPYQANGSIIEVNGKRYGSVLLGQSFTGPAYLWGRVMKLDTTTFIGPDGEPQMYATPVNLSPASDDFDKAMRERVANIHAAQPEDGDKPIPQDLVTVSGSGLDPHISPAAAEYQAERIARARSMDAGQVRDIVAKYTQGRFLGVFGEPTVNVLQVNLALDGVLK